MGNIINTELGKILISQDVIGRIAGHTAIQCYGLVGMARKKLTDEVAELLGRESLQKGVVVKIDGEKLNIELYIIVSYGVNIAQVASIVMEQVKYAVESLTGLTVEKVNVVVQGVRVTE